MKSTLTYEMHNYAALSSPNIAEAKRSAKDKVEKYSLRQRQKQRPTKEESSNDSLGYTSDNSNNNDAEYATTASIKPVTAVRESARNSARNAAAAAAKSKTKAAPLSKYRRKTANARERTRMREINSAFENLRHCVPHTITGEDTANTNEKLTKITTLRLAMKYIRILNEALDNPHFKADFLQQCKQDGDYRFTEAYVPSRMPVVEMDVESDPIVATPQTPAKTKSAKATTKTGQARKSSAKRPAKKQKLQQQIVAPAELLSTLNCESACSTTSSTNNSYASLTNGIAFDVASPSPSSSHGSSSTCLLDGSVNSSSYISNASQTMSELSTLVLESDGESLHLSEHCLSPTAGYSLLGAMNTCKTTDSVLNSYDSHGDSTAMSLENPLELNLRLLESSSLDFVGDEQPPSCISPLVTLDSFNPFSDLLSEHSSLDLFLT